MAKRRSERKRKHGKYRELSREERSWRSSRPFTSRWAAQSSVSVDARLPRSTDMLALCVFFLLVVVSPHATERDGSRAIPLTRQKVCNAQTNTAFFIVTRPFSLRRRRKLPLIIFITHHHHSLSFSSLSYTTGWCLFWQVSILLRDFQYYHVPGSLTNKQIATLSDLTNVTHTNEVLDNICVVRIVGTVEHAKVKKVRSE